MDTDRNLLFGVLALQADLLDPPRFAEACAAWAARKDTPLADLLVERGWLSAADRADVDKLLQRKLAKHAGDARVSLAEIATDDVRQSLSSLDDPGVHESLAELTAAATPADGPLAGGPGEGLWPFRQHRARPGRARGGPALVCEGRCFPGTVP